MSLLVDEGSTGVRLDILFLLYVLMLCSARSWWDRIKELWCNSKRYDVVWGFGGDCPCIEQLLKYWIIQRQVHEKHIYKIETKRHPDATLVARSTRLHFCFFYLGLACLFCIAYWSLFLNSLRAWVYAPNRLLTPDFAYSQVNDKVRCLLRHPNMIKLATVVYPKNTAKFYNVHTNYI